MKYRVEIKDISGDLGILQEVFAELSIDTVEENRRLFATSDQFEALSSASAVHECIWNIQTKAAVVRTLDPEIVTDYKVGRIFEREPGGNVKEHNFVGGTGSLTGRAQLSGQGFAMVVDLTEEQRKQFAEEIQKKEHERLTKKTVSKIVSAVKCDIALQVQRLLAGELSAQTMYHIFELIRDDLGGDLKSLTSEKQLKRFTGSINHPEGFGDNARHMVPDRKPPVNPMRPEEAKRYIVELGTRWLEYKAGE